jgi:hypothetical protein
VGSLHCQLLPLGQWTHAHTCILPIYVNYRPFHEMIFHFYSFPTDDKFSWIQFLQIFGQFSVRKTLCVVDLSPHFVFKSIKIISLFFHNYFFFNKSFTSCIIRLCCRVKHVLTLYAFILVMCRRATIILMVVWPMTSMIHASEGEQYATFAEGADVSIRLRLLFGIRMATYHYLH